MVEHGAETSHSVIFTPGGFHSPKVRRIGGINSMRCSPPGMVQSKPWPRANGAFSFCEREGGAPLGEVVRDSR